MYDNINFNIYCTDLDLDLFASHKLLLFSNRTYFNRFGEKIKYQNGMNYVTDIKKRVALLLSTLEIRIYRSSVSGEVKNHPANRLKLVITPTSSGVLV